MPNICFEHGEVDGPVHEHHVVPRSRGGTQTVPLCEECHGKAHASSMKTSKLVREGMAKRRASGRRYSGVIPYGFELCEDGETLSPNHDERSVIRTVRVLRNNGYSLCRISKVLAESGIFNRKGNAFGHSSVKKLIESQWRHEDD